MRCRRPRRGAAAPSTATAPPSAAPSVSRGADEVSDASIRVNTLPCDRGGTGRAARRRALRRRRNVLAPRVSCNLKAERFPIQDGSWFYEKSAVEHDRDRCRTGGLRRQLSLFELNLDPGGGDATHNLVLEHHDYLDDQDDGPQDRPSPQGCGPQATTTTTHTATAAAPPVTTTSAPPPVTTSSAPKPVVAPPKPTTTSSTQPPAPPRVTASRTRATRRAAAPA